MKNSFTFLFLILPLINNFAQSPEYTFYRFPAESVPPVIKSLYQDREGYIWFGSLNSFTRFDGFSFKHYEHDPGDKHSLSIGFTSIFYEDSKNNFWVGTTTSLELFDRSSGKFKHYKPDPGGHVFRNDFWTIHEDSHGRFWAGTTMGLYYLDKESDQLIDFIPKNNQELISHKSFRVIKEDEQGNLWFGTSIGLLKYNYKTEEIIPFWIDPDRNSLSLITTATGDYAVQTICTDETGIYWVGTFGGKLMKLDPLKGTYEIFLMQNEMTKEKFPITSICAEGNDKLWIGTYSGLILFSKFNGEVLGHYTYNENSKESISDNKISALYKDNSGALWIGTTAGGLNKLNRTGFQFNKVEKKAWAAEKAYSMIPFQDMVVSKTGKIFAGTMKGIEKMDAAGNLIALLKPFKAINTLMEDSEGNLWIGIKQFSGGGLYKRDRN
jgi:ligand-binding sensor domain-containing protein